MKGWKFKASVIAVCLLIGALVAGCGGGSKPKTSSSTPPATQQTAPAPAQTPPPAPEPPKAVPTLHVDPYAFQTRYNEFMHTEGGQIGASGGLDIGEPNISNGSVNNTVAYANNNLNLALNETIDKASGEIKEVFITSAIAGKDGKTIQASLMAAIMSYNALIAAVDPEADIDAIQAALGLHESIDKWVKDTDTTVNNVKYFKRVVKGIGLIFGAEAK